MLCFRVLTDYLHLLEDWKVRYAPKTPENALDDRFVEACQMHCHIEYMADVLTVGDLEERVALVDKLMKEGKIAFLQEYRKMSADYEAEQERLKLEIEVIEEWVEQREEMNDGLDAFIALTQKYVDVEELTQTIVNEYIKKIIVYAPDKSSGKRKQKVKIFFNFVDDVDIPVISEPIITQTTYEHRKTA